MREWHLATAVFVIAEGRVVLGFHRRLQKWLPPGGHVEPQELPHEAAVREVREETGLDCRIIGKTGIDVTEPIQIVLPLGIQLEEIDPDHQHLDFVYLATTKTGKAELIVANHELEPIDWFTLQQALELPLSTEMRLWVTKAFLELSQYHRN